ncbi:hypothetical protein MIMGU_mgv1a022339mg [Erythranthe guttata]|uniref:Uncharacterized protein n=1 Tax=Erythranthe guttata TaxID=4155 RepID=A0A022PU40_ERYGU|nr:hypothetical protein MIMGU_mgv1a022339mg [Erythranthe guttata]
MRSLPSSNRAVDSETQIKDAVHRFEDLINRHISDWFQSGSKISKDDQSFKLVLSQQLQIVKQEISSFTKTLKAEEHYSTEEDKQQQQQHHHQKQSYYFAWQIHRREKMVGLDSELKELQDWLFSGDPKRDVMSVVGMAGIGKTTFVEQVYYNSRLVENHFKHRLFLPIGPHYQLKDTLLLALDQLGVHENLNKNPLSNYVYKSLLGTKYLVVLDDVWNTRVWDQLRHVFPDNRNGSRIILTTQLLSLTRPIGGKTIQIPLLDEDQSWKLLREIVFTRGESCSKELEKIGRKIAKKCEGLPLAIIEVGKLLSKIDKMVEKWKTVAENEDPLTITIDDDTPLSKALLLSYDMLPQYLKVCFLYMGVFPKSYEIPRSKLIDLWASEGFLDPQNKGKKRSLEETGDECLNELISRSVVLNTKLSSVDTKRTKTCRLHFTFRNICVSEAQSKKFFPIIKKYNESSFPEDVIKKQRRLCFQNNVVLGIEQVRTWMEESLPGARSLLCFGPKQQYPVDLYLGFKLLKVLDALAIRFYEFPHRVLNLDGDELPSSISCLWKLEVLIVHRHHNIKSSNLPPVYLPIEIWKLHELKHIDCVGFDLPEPSPADDSLILEKLLTLSGVSAHSCTQGVLARTPRLAKLGIRVEASQEDEAFEALSFFGGDYFASRAEFESFKCHVVDPSPRCRAVCSMVNFPKNIKKITLSGCGFPWENVKAIADLPNLLVLKLRWSAFCGAKWETTTCGEEIGFPKLKLLLMEDLDIQKWEAGNEHFPMLERLIIRHCYKLEKIPPEIGDIPLLEMIQVDDCNPAVVTSARGIQDKKASWGNDKFRIQIHSSWDNEKPTRE